MRYRVFGRKTGLRVSEVAFGTGNFGTRWGHGATKDEAQRLFDRYADAGGNFIDAADGYQFGEAEELLGDFLKKDRDHFVVASKYTLGTGPADGLSRTGNNRKSMRLAVEGSLKRLKTDHLDLYWVHMADGVTPIEEIMRGLDDLVRAGKIHYAGLSNFPAWRVSRADLLSEIHGWAPIAGIQIEYSLAERSPDRELLPMAEALGVGVATWSPLGGGFLTGKYRPDSNLGSDDGRLTKLGILVHSEKSARETAILDAVTLIATETGATPTHVAIAWLRAKAARSSTAIIPILGSRTLKQLDDTLGALDLDLSDDQVARLDAASAVVMGVPHDVLRDTNPKMYGGKLEAMHLPKLPVA